MKLAAPARFAVAAALGLSVLIALMSVRAGLEARARAGEGDVALAAGDVEGAITAYRLAARWNGPLNPYARAAYDALERLGGAAEARGDAGQALRAYRALYGAAMASRGAWLPERARVARVSSRIAALVQRADDDADPGGLGGAVVTPFAPVRPRPFGILLAWLGFAAWVLGASVFLRRGVDAQGRLVRRVARTGAAFALLGWLAFALGLRLA